MLTRATTRWLTSLFLATVTLGGGIATAAAAPSAPPKPVVAHPIPSSPSDGRQVAKADLVVDAIRAATNPLVGDQPARFCVTVRNKGGAPAYSAAVRLYVDYAPVGEQTMSVGASQSAPACFDNVTASGGRTHRVSAYADATRRVPEQNDLNNLRSEEFPWLDSRPDLSIAFVTVRGKENPDGFMDCDPGKNTVYALIRNASTVPAGKFVVRLRVDGNEPRNDEYEIERLGPGEEALAEFQKAKIKGKDVQHQIRLVVDADNRVSERDETNNVRELTVTCANEEGDD